MKRLIAIAILLIALPAVGAQLTLTWEDPNTTETAHHIERCAGATCTNFAQIAQIGSNLTTYVDTTVATGTTYCYRVRASNATGFSGYSNTACNAPATPTISISPLVIVFTGVLGGPVPPPIVVTVTTSNNASWTSNHACAFSALPASGASGATQTISIAAADWVVIGAGLGPGTYPCPLTYSSAGAADLVVQITITITAPPPAAPANLKVAP